MTVDELITRLAPYRGKRVAIEVAIRSLEGVWLPSVVDDSTIEVVSVNNVVRLLATVDEPMLDPIDMEEL
jgi:hypothetical protein